MDQLKVVLVIAYSRGVCARLVLDENDGIIGYQYTNLWKNDGKIDAGITPDVALQNSTDITEDIWRRSIYCSRKE